MISKYIVYLLALISIISIINELEHVFASPFVVRQEIKDPPNDWGIVNNTAGCAGVKKDIFFPPDIRAVSYFSNGRILNVTMWLSSHFKELNPSLDSITYGMSIHVHSGYQISVIPIDYQVSIFPNVSTNTWSRTIEELSSTGELKTIEPEDHNYTGFFHPGKKYVNFSLDLSKVSNPNEYSLFLFTQTTFTMKETFVRCTIIDTSYRVNIPPPTLGISESPNPVIVRPGEQETVNVLVNSTTLGFDPVIHLSAKNQTNIQLDFKSNDVPLPTTNFPGTADLPLRITISKNATDRPYPIPITANMSDTYISNPSSGEVPNIQNQRIFAPITGNHLLTVIVQKPLTFDEKFDAFWKVYGGVIGFVGGGFAVGASSLAFDRLRKRSKRKDAQLDKWSDKDK
jgi:hypothetical protein